MIDNNSKGPTFNLPKPEPALLRHASNLYEGMYDEVIETQFKGDIYDIYNGFLGKTFAKCGISNQYYGKVLKLLENYGCIATIERGVRNSPSRVVMLTHPREAEIPPEALGVKPPKNTAENLTTPANLATLSESVKNLKGQLGGISLAELAQGLQTELTEIRGRLSVLETAAQVKNNGEGAVT